MSGRAVARCGILVACLLLVAGTGSAAEREPRCQDLDHTVLDAFVGKSAAEARAALTALPGIRRVVVEEGRMPQPVGVMPTRARIETNRGIVMQVRCG